MTCTVTEAAPTNPTGWTFGTPTYNPLGGTVTITKGLAAAAVEVTVTNTISQDQGYFKVSKVFDPLTSGFTGDFTMNYVCTDDSATTSSVDVAAGATSAAIGPIDTHNGATPVTCTVTEAAPTNPTGWTFGTPTYNPLGGTVTITKGLAAAAVEVTVTNTISQDQGYFKVSKVFDPLTSGFTGDFTMNYVCTDDSATTSSVDVGGRRDERGHRPDRHPQRRDPGDLHGHRGGPDQPDRLDLRDADLQPARRDGDDHQGSRRRRGRGHRHQHDQPGPGLLQGQQGLRPADLGLHRRLHDELRLHRRQRDDQLGRRGGRCRRARPSARSTPTTARPR